MTYTINSTVSEQIYTNYTPTMTAEIIHNMPAETFAEFSTHERSYMNIRRQPTALRKGIIEWDITDIPDDAEIKHVAFLYENINITTASTATSKVQIQAFTYWQPSTVSDNSGASDIWVDIYTKTRFASRPTYAPWDENVSSSYYYFNYFPEKALRNNCHITLGNVDYAVSTATAITDLTAQLSKDWFAIGLRPDDEVTSQWGAYLPTARWRNATPPPTLWVSYDLNTTITLREPERVNRVLDKDMKNPPGAHPVLRPHTIGDTSKQIMITGFENSSASDTLEDIRIISTLNREVKIDGLPDSDLDGYYVIKKFSYAKEPGRPDQMRYNLVLEKFKKMNVYKFFT